MEWEAYLVWLNFLANTHCRQEAPIRKQEQCVEVITDCVLDGETFNFCKKNWQVDYGV